MRTGELRGLIDPCLVPFEKRFDKRIFATEAGQQRRVHVDSLSRLAPAQNGEPADEAEPPLLRYAQSLELGGSADDPGHARRAL